MNRSRSKHLQQDWSTSAFSLSQFNALVTNMTVHPSKHADGALIWASLFIWTFWFNKLVSQQIKTSLHTTLLKKLVLCDKNSNSGFDHMCHEFCSQHTWSVLCLSPQRCGSEGWGLILISYPFSLFSSGPGYDYWSQKACGWSVGVNWAEYCLNRNSCAALYPDVANHVCVCDSGVDAGFFCRALELVGPCGRAVTIPLRLQLDYDLLFPECSNDADCVLSSIDLKKWIW